MAKNNTMNVNELMVGDWVKVSHLNKVGKIYRIDCANGEKNAHVAVFHGDFSINDIEPVPLSPEILEKNGFGFLNCKESLSAWNGWWIYKGLELGVCNITREGNWPCFINIYDSNVECKYVHQLQNALRLCGIEKDIEL